MHSTQLTGDRFPGGKPAGSRSSNRNDTQSRITDAMVKDINCERGEVSGFITSQKSAVVIPFRSRRKTRDSLPIVDIDGLYDRNPSVRRSTAGQIGEIAMDSGFLYLRNHSVSPSLLEATYEQARYFFNQDKARKDRYFIGNTTKHRGYVPITEKGEYADEVGPRRYEAFDMGLDLDPRDPDSLSANPLLGPNVWPDQPGFKYVLNRYMSEMSRVSHMMFRAFEIALDLRRGFFSENMKKPISQLRLIHYLENKCNAGESNINMGAHTDYECFTILHSSSPCLQIFDPTSKWIDAPPVDNTFYFNIGDMLEAWSGGLLVATPHRVANNGKERFSLPYFAATDYHTAVYPLDCRKYRDRQKVYSPVIAGEHLLSQLLRDFPYLRKRYEAGLLPSSVQPRENPFERRIAQPQAM